MQRNAKNRIPSGHLIGSRPDGMTGSSGTMWDRCHSGEKGAEGPEVSPASATAARCHGTQARRGAAQTLQRGRKLTPDQQEPDELLRTNSIEVSGFKNNGSHADSRYSEWQRQYLERQLCIITPQVYSRNPGRLCCQVILIHIPIKWHL